MEALWKRRRALLATAAVGVAAAYVYRSERARRLTRDVYESADAFTKFAEVALALSRDINQFVIAGGEDDEVPNSVKQALKLAQCPEAESLMQTVACAFARGSLAGAGLSKVRTNIQPFTGNTFLLLGNWTCVRSTFSFINY